MHIKAKIEAIIYAAEEPVTLDQLAEALKDAGLLEELMRPKAEESTGGVDEGEVSSDGLAARESAALLRGMAAFRRADTLPEKPGGTGMPTRRPRSSMSTSSRDSRVSK